MNDDDDAEEFDIFLFHSAAAAFIEIDREREVRKETLLLVGLWRYQICMHHC